MLDKLTEYKYNNKQKGDNIMLNKTYLGQPVVLNKNVYGRIVSLEGTEANSRTLNSIVQFSTPSCNVLRTGIFHLDEATEKDIIKLKEFEQWHTDNRPDDEMYAGMLKNIDLKS